jgi:hypothetical protein
MAMLGMACSKEGNNSNRGRKNGKSRNGDNVVEVVKVLWSKWKEVMIDAA